MICPSCNQSATSFLRNSFSLQGVTFLQSVRGELRCQHCGTLLRNVRFGKQLWLYFGAMAFFVVLMTFFSTRLYLVFGMAGIAAYWIILCVLFILVYAWGVWRYAVVEKVAEDATKSS